MGRIEIIFQFVRVKRKIPRGSKDDMVREKPIRIEIREEAGGTKAIVRSYADGRVEIEPIVSMHGPRKRHILGIRKLSLDKTRKKSF